MHGKQHITPHALSGGVNCCFPIITSLSATTGVSNTTFLLVVVEDNEDALGSSGLGTTAPTIDIESVLQNDYIFIKSFF